MKKLVVFVLSVCLLIAGITGCTKNKDTNCPQYTIYIPNSFSPNGDNKNDVFVAKCDHIVDYEMQIFDKNGDKLYDSKDLNNGWDGTNNGGNACPSGIYVYLIKVTDQCGNKHTYTGNLTLIR